MSFGLLFIPPEDRIEPSLAKVYLNVVEEKVRSRIVPPNPYLDKTTRNLGRLFNTSVDDPKVLARARKGKKSRDVDGNRKGSETVDNHLEHHVKYKQSSSKGKFLSTTSTIQALNSIPGGKFAVPSVSSSYEHRLMGMPSSSAYNENSPKMWPAEVQYPSSSARSPDSFDHSLASTFDTNTFGTKKAASNKKKLLAKSGNLPLSPLPSSRPCSKQGSEGRVVVQSGPLSDLQQTLSQCGKLTLLDSRSLEQKKSVLESSVEHHKKGLQRHVDWLRQGFQNKESWHHKDLKDSIDILDDDIQADHHDSSKSVQTHSTMSQSANSSWIQLNASSSRVHSKFSKPYEDEQISYLSNLKVHSFANSLNPFRQGHGNNRSTVRYSRSIPRINRPKDNMDYKDNLFVKTISSFNACIEPSIDIYKVPSKKEVSNALFQLTRKQIIVYNARIVEVGSMIRAFRDSKHETPGLQAIFALHQAFVSATVLSTNPYILSRKQMYAVIESQVPWVSGESISRLLMSFDNTNTGYIRYVRLSCSLLACLEPAMANLAASLDKTHAKMWNKIADSSQLSSLDEVPSYTEEEMKDLKGELLVIRFLHRLYCECNGYLETTSVQTTTPLMQLQDIPELFSCCSCSPEDEQAIAALVEPLVQGAYDLAIKGGGVAGSSPLKVKDVLKYPQLRADFGQLSISADILIESVLKSPGLFKEFVRQMRSYRQAAKAYIYNTSKSIEDSLAHFSESQSHKVSSM